MSHSLLNIIIIIISFYKGGVMDKEIYKEIYQKSSYGSDIPSETYPPPNPGTSRIYLNPPSSPLSYGCHLWMAPD